MTPHILSAIPGMRLDDVKQKSNVQPESVSYKRYMATQHKPSPDDPCYRYVDPHVDNPGALRYGCEDYVKKYKGKVQR